MSRKKKTEKMADENSKELATQQDTGTQLVLGPDSVKRAAKIAKELTAVIEQQKLYTVIQGRKHVHVEGWNILGAMLGVFPEIEDVTKLPARRINISLVDIPYTDKQTRQRKTFQKWVRTELLKGDQKAIEEKEIDEVAYKSTAALKTTQGRVVTRAQNMCTNLEDGKLDKEEYSIMSMAETRATGKAFRLAFSWIIKMAGYDVVPLEEVPEGGLTYSDADMPADMRGGETRVDGGGFGIKPKAPGPAGQGRMA